MSLVAYDNSSDESEEESKPVKKQKESVKITIPSLKEFEDEDEEKPIAKKLKLQGSGLFSLLPPPKNISSSNKSGFMPHILVSKKEKTSISSTQNKNSSIPVSTSLKTTSQPSSASTALEEHESDDEAVSTKDSSNATGSCDFFWLDDLASKNESKVEDVFSAPAKDINFLQHLPSQLPCSSTSSIHKPYLNEIEKPVYLKQHQIPAAEASQKVEESTDWVSYEQQLQPTDNSLADGSKDTLLNDEEFRKLQGRRREFGDIDIIDVNADDQLTGRNEWLVKSVTEETSYRPKIKHGLPTQQQKRKHQITYLAFQAKEREMDLKNQWALNRLTRRETQSKYGF